MSRIDKLIRELCPSGVRFSSLGDIADLKRGKTITKREANSDGNIPVVAGGRSAAYYHDASNRSAPVIVVAGSGAYAGFVSWWSKPIWISDAFSVIPSRDELDNRFLFYLLKAKQDWLHSIKSGSGVPHVYPKDVAKLRIPVPPLEVQREIVRILDTFTELEAELDAELEARRKQYEHYRNDLLSFSDEETQFLSLGECIYENRGGGTPSRGREELWGGDIPWASVGDIAASSVQIHSPRQAITEEGLKSCSSNLIPKGWVIVAVKISPGEMRVVEQEMAINQDLRGLKLKETLDPYFLTYYLKTISIVGNGTIVQGITNSTLEKIRIPLPTLERQREIVGILNNFEELVGGITKGLPAEIEARRKQYEYYRDKLLSFEEAV